MLGAVWSDSTLLAINATLELTQTTEQTTHVVNGEKRVNYKKANRHIDKRCNAAFHQSATLAKVVKVKTNKFWDRN